MTTRKDSKTKKTPVSIKAVTEPRVYYQSERVTLYHGDCRQVLPLLSGVDALVTDPPYGLSNIGKRHKGQAGCGVRNLDFFPNDTLADGFAHVDTLIQATAALAPHGCVYAWLGHHQFAKATLAFHELGWQSRFLVWNRTAPVPPPPWSGWPSGASLCLFAYRVGKKWESHPADMPRSNVLTCDNFRAGNGEKNGHPTQMNPLLVAEPIRCSTAPGDTVLDLYTGSGTTGEAAIKLGRKFIGCELEERFCEMSARRIQEAEQAFALFEPTPQEKQAEMFHD